jgi:endoglucanase
MKTKPFLAIAERLMRHPAAPYHEAAVRAEAEDICRENGLRFEHDAFGNVLVRLQSVPRLRPIVLSAHLDHPAFEIVSMLKEDRLRARFLGGVPDAYFRLGVRLRLLPGLVPARLGNRLGPAPAKDFEIVVEAPFEARPAFAVWELPDFAVRGQKIHGRACDDLIGVASILATLIDLKRSRARVNVVGVLSRAEEVGFQGVLALCDSRKLPKRGLVISLETSKELPPVKMGQGVILRVGDKASVFDSAATRFLHEVALDHQHKDKSFSFQRALMSGGTCEGTAYQESGFQTAAVCVALGNYHNCGRANRLAAEYVNIGDALSMVRLLSAAATEMANFRSHSDKLPQRLHALLRTAKKRLLKHG